MTHDTADRHFRAPRIRNEKKGLGIGQLLLAFGVGGGLAAAAITRGPEAVEYVRDNFVPPVSSGERPGDSVRTPSVEPLRDRLGLTFVQFTDRGYVAGHTIPLQGERMSTPRCEYLIRSSPSIWALSEGGCTSPEQTAELTVMREEFLSNRAGSD
jgi:hypothetical protein